MDSPSPSKKLQALRRLEALEPSARCAELAPRAANLLYLIRDSDESPSVRRMSVRLLRSLRPDDLTPGTVPAVVQRLDDDDPRMREEALLFLETLESTSLQRAVEAVVRICSNEAETPEVKVAAVRVLGRLDPEALDALLDDDASASADVDDMVARNPSARTVAIRQALKVAGKTTLAAGRNGIAAGQRRCSSIRMSISSPLKAMDSPRASPSCGRVGGCEAGSPVEGRGSDACGDASPSAAAGPSPRKSLSGSLLHVASGLQPKAAVAAVARRASRLSISRDRDEASPSSISPRQSAATTAADGGGPPADGVDDVNGDKDATLTAAHDPSLGETRGVC